jgi:hypothetical protein
MSVHTNLAKNADSVEELTVKNCDMETLDAMGLQVVRRDDQAKGIAYFQVDLLRARWKSIWRGVTKGRMSRSMNWRRKARKASLDKQRVLVRSHALKHPLVSVKWKASDMFNLGSYTLATLILAASHQL